VLVLVLVATVGGASQADAPAAAGQVLAFGNDDSGEIGTSTLTPPTSTFAPVLVDLPATSPHATAIAAGYAHSLIVTSDGRLYAFGSNGGGELGTTTAAGTGTPESTPTPVTLPGATGTVTQAAAGQFFSLAATSTGQVYAFGMNPQGQLGNLTNTGTPTPNPTPALVTLPGASGQIVQLAAGAEHSLALTSTGQAFAWGDNHYGELGYGTNIGTDNPNPTPAQIVLPAGAGPIVQIAAGSFFSLVLTAAGQVYAFGVNVQGQLGNTTNNGLFAANPARTLVGFTEATGPIVQIAAGKSHSLALTSTGQLYAFGDNYNGQLGSVTGLTNPAPTLADIPAGTAIEALAQGSQSSHALALVSGLAVLNGSLAAGQIGVPYATTVAVGGGAAPYTLTASGLAPGLSLDPAGGQITGTPTTAGSFSAVFTITDAAGITVTSPALALTIAPAATATTSTKGTTAHATTAAVGSSLLTQLAPKGKPAKIAALLKAKRYALSFKALRAGTVVVNWFSVPKGKQATLIASGRMTFKAAGTATLILRLTAKGAHLLRGAKRLKVTARSTFTSHGAAPVSKSRSFTLTR
jgi:alpha-tubulin suppressor-like RCC1 family protein